MIDYNTAVVLVGVSGLGATAGAVGSFLVLRRRALAGDALAHASLPGLVTAFLIFERRELHLLLAGALMSALAGIGVVSLLRRFSRVKEDAAIGIVLSVFFGAGIVLSRLVQNRSTAGSKAGLDSFLLGKTAGMIFQDAVVISIVSVVTLLVIGFLFKEFKLLTFDAGFATAQGWPTLGLDLVLMSLVAINIMIGLPAVGVVLVAALLILPAVTARFWTERLETMVVLAALIGSASGALGTMVSAWVRGLPAGPMIILSGSAFLIVSLLASPRRGIVARLLSEWRFQHTVEDRSLLREIYEFAEEKNRWPVPAEVVHRAGERRSLQRLKKSGWVHSDARKILELTPAGQERARTVVQGHRLWHMFLEVHPDLAGSLANLAEESVDRILPSDMVESLTSELAERGQWPAPQLSVRA